MSIRRCTIAELEASPNLAEVLAQYSRESSMPEIGVGSPQIETYRAMQASGYLHPIGAFEGDQLAGFILPVVISLPHYGVLVGTVESFFVMAKYRAGGVGIQLRDTAEELAAGLGAKALMLSAAVGGTLDKVMARNSRYRHSNNVYVVALT